MSRLRAAIAAIELRSIRFKREVEGALGHALHSFCANSKAVTDDLASQPQDLAGPVDHSGSSKI